MRHSCAPCGSGYKPAMRWVGRFLPLLVVPYVFGALLSSTTHGASYDRGQPQDAGRHCETSGKVQDEVRKQEPKLTDTKISEPARSNSDGVPFLKQSLLFAPNSVELGRESRNSIKRIASWLGEHRKVRVLIVGFCDPSGSEDCTHTLAERRSTAVEQLLLKYGTNPAQITAAKGWEKAYPVCAVANTACQAVNRRARIFITDLGSAR